MKIVSQALLFSSLFESTFSLKNAIDSDVKSPFIRKIGQNGKDDEDTCVGYSSVFDSDDWASNLDNETLYTIFCSTMNETETYYFPDYSDPAFCPIECGNYTCLDYFEFIGQDGDNETLLDDGYMEFLLISLCSGENETYYFDDSNGLPLCPIECGNYTSSCLDYFEWINEQNNDEYGYDDFFANLDNETFYTLLCFEENVTETYYFGDDDFGSIFCPIECGNHTSSCIDYFEYIGQDGDNETLLNWFCFGDEETYYFDDDDFGSIFCPIECCTYADGEDERSFEDCCDLSCDDGVFTCELYGCGEDSCVDFFEYVGHFGDDYFSEINYDDEGIDDFFCAGDEETYYFDDDYDFFNSSFCPIECPPTSLPSQDQSSNLISSFIELLQSLINFLLALFGE